MDNHLNHRLQRPVAVRVAGGLLWTAALLAGLWGVDRLIFGPPVAHGWQRVASGTEIDPALGPSVMPSYLGEALRWPPVSTWQQLHPKRGWWLALDGPGDDEPLLWIGNLADPPPAMPQGAAGCLRFGPRQNCQRPWHHLSTSVRGVGQVSLLTRLPAVQASRILRGLRPVRSASLGR